MIKELIENVREYKDKAKDIDKARKLAIASRDAIRYYNVEFDDNGRAYITFDGERITTPDESQEAMLSKLLTLRQLYVEHKLNQ